MGVDLFQNAKYQIGQLLRHKGQPTEALTIYFVLSRRAEQMADGHIVFDYLCRLVIPGTIYGLQSEPLPMLESELIPHQEEDSQPRVVARRPCPPDISRMQV